MNLVPGSIAFVGFSYGQNERTDALAFAALSDIAAGTVIQFSSGYWRGESFSNNSTLWSWEATSDVPAGTVVTMEMPNGVTPTSNLGDITVHGGTGVALSSTAIVYAYVGEPAAPTFLSAFAAGSLEGARNNPATLDGTGLTEGLNAVALGGIDIAVYDGPRLGAGSLADYLPAISDPASWISQRASGDLTDDGIPPDLPFSLAGFSADPNVQVVNFAADSLGVSQPEGDDGETVLTFVVERSGDTAGTVTFSGVIDFTGTTRADDFGGTAPLGFTGTIEAGQASATVTVRVSGDTTFERDEGFTLSLQRVSSDGANAVLGEDTIATGTIVNDDPAPARIAFVAYNAEGTDNLGFLAVSDIAAGTTIHFANCNWLGSEFEIDPNGGDAMWSWTADSDIAAGTVITMDGLNSGAATSSHGTIAFTSQTSAELNDRTGRTIGERVYAYLGTAEEPTAFLTAITTTTFGQFLDGTELTEGVDAVALNNRDLDIAQYRGPRTGESSFEDYLAQIHDPANWTIQGNRNQDTASDGIFPDAPFRTLPFSVDPTAQIVQFAASSRTVTQNEGEPGTATALTFTVERTNGTDGDLAFTVRVPGGTYADAADAADFVGNALPVVTGTIRHGESSATVTILVKGDRLYELNERFQLVLESASNPNATSVVIGNDSIAAVTIRNDDNQPDRVRAGEAHTAPIVLGTDAHFVIEKRGSTGDIAWSGSAEIVIDNRGETGSITAAGGSGGSVVVNNSKTGVIRGMVSAEDAGRTDYTLNNAGRIELFGDRMDLRDPADRGASVVVNNLAGGVIVQTEARHDIMRPGDQNTVVNNYGSILHAQGIVGGSSDGIQGDAVKVNNFARGLIEGARHAVTGDANVEVYNEGRMVGRNGSAVNIDNNGTEEERVLVINCGRMEGRSAELVDSDGDAVDVDGLLTLHNYGFIGGMGHEGYHDGEPNVSEGLAIGGGIIHNYKGGEIYGYGRGIQVDNSSNSDALGATTIVNAGLIRGDGNRPEGVAPEDLAAFDLRGNEAINLVGNLADSLTNSGKIVGGASLGGGDDTLVNTGTMKATGGSAVDLGAGNDSLTSRGKIVGDVLLGEGDDALTLLDGAVVLGSVTGGAGADTMRGADGRDDFDGGDGDDTLHGGLGDDTLRGGEGNDRLFGNTSVSTYRGKHSGAHRDPWQSARCAEDDDVLDGGAGDDLLSGGAGSDRMIGGAGNDTLIGDDDTSAGPAYDAWCRPGRWGAFDRHDHRTHAAKSRELSFRRQEDDRLLGGEGDDALFGGTGRDRLDGGTGADVLTGGDDGDLFVFDRGCGTDVITDFYPGDDLIALNGFSIASFHDLRRAARDDGDDVVITLDGANGDALRLVGINKNDLDADDFVFNAA